MERSYRYRMGRKLREDDVQGPATERGGKTFDDLKDFKVEDAEVKLPGSCLQMLLLQCMGCAAGHALGTARVIKLLPAPNWKGI